MHSHFLLLCLFLRFLGSVCPNFNLCFLSTLTQLILLCIALSLEFTSRSPVVTASCPPSIPAQDCVLPNLPTHPGNHRCEMRCLCCLMVVFFLSISRALTFEDFMAITQQEPINTNTEHLNQSERTRLPTVTFLNLKYIVKGYKESIAFPV